MKLPGTRFKTDERKYFSHTAHSEAVELVLRDAGDARGVDRSSIRPPRALKCRADDRACATGRSWEGAGAVLLSACCGVTLWFSI